MRGGPLLITCLLAAGIAGIRGVDRILPRGVTPSTRSYEDLKAEFKPWLNFSNKLVLTLVAASILGWFLGLLGIEALLAHRFPPAVFVLRPARLIFLLPAVFLGLVTTALLHERLVRRQLKERYSDFWTFEARHRLLGRQKSTRDPTVDDYRGERRGLVFVLPLLAVASLIFVCLSLDTYAYVTSSEIVVNPFLGFEEHHHRYDDVASVHMRLVGRGNNRLDCVIEFKDGTSLTTRTLPSRLSDDETRKLTGFVFARTTGPSN